MEHKVFSEDEFFISSMMHFFTKMMTEDIELSESVSLIFILSCHVHVILIRAWNYDHICLKFTLLTISWISSILQSNVISLKGNKVLSC